jgi:DNA-binding beta-propeller fold protein YncE
VRGPVLALLCLLTTACGEAPTERSRDARLPVWTIGGLAQPESVALGADGRTLYIANVGGEGEAKDGNGYISRATTGGKLTQQQWITGLDAPKGAMVKGDRLYVSDIDRLVEIDIPAGKVAARYPIPGAKFLNDVAVAPDGTVLVSDSDTARIFALKDGKVSVWSDSPELRSVNGLLAEPGRLVVTTMQGKLLAIDYPARTVKVLATGLGDADGVTAADGDNYFVSEWPGRLFRVSPDGKAKVMMDTRQKGAYINDFIRVGDLLIVPSWEPGKVSAYRVLTWMLTEADTEDLPPHLRRVVL